METPWLKQKSEDAIRSQVLETEKEIGERVAPESVPADEVLHMPLEELKSKFPRRYEIYVDLLRANRKNGASDISNEETKEFKKWLGILNSVDTYDQKYRSEISEDPRHLKQQEVFSELRDFLEQGNKSGYVKLPTGSGKTVIFKRFLEAVHVPSLVVVPNNVLVEQTVKQLNKSTLNGDVGVVNMHSKEFESKYTVTTYASLVRNLKSGELRPDAYSFVILDEAHKALGTETSEAIQKLNGAVIVGFTATPEYTTEKGVSQLLDHEIYRMNVAEAIGAGMLSHAKTSIYKTRIDMSSVHLRNGEYVKDELEQKLNVVARNKAAVEYYKKEFMGMQGVAYCISIAHAKSVKKLFAEAGIEAEVISGENTQKEKQGVLERYKRGEIKMLCNADILIEGFDHAKAAVCLNLRPTMSAVIAEQRGGRVLRLDPEDPDKTGYVIDFLDDDQSVANLERPMPILYGEVLGAMAVPRAVASEADPTRSKKPSGGASAGADEDDLNHLDLNIISTEEQFKEILQQKEMYKQAVATRAEDKRRREEEKKREAEMSERAAQLYKEYVKIKPEFDIVVKKTLETVRSISGVSYITRGKLDNELGDLYQIFNKSMEGLRRRILRLRGRGDIANVPTAKELKEKADALYNKARAAYARGEAQYALKERIRSDHGISHKNPQNHEKLRLGNSAEARNWLTKMEVKAHGRSLGIGAGLWAEKMNELEKEHEEWVALKYEDAGNIARRYSPRFLEELEYKIFQTSHRAEMVMRGSEARVQNWKTDQDLQDFVGSLGLETEQVFSLIKSIERNHPMWVALRESGPRTLTHVYSPEFFDKFETEVLNEVVEREARNQ